MERLVKKGIWLGGVWASYSRAGLKLHVQRPLKFKFRLAGTIKLELDHMGWSRAIARGNFFQQKVACFEHECFDRLRIQK